MVKTRALVTACIAVATALPAPSYGQDLMTMRVLLGSPTALAVDVEYHDPSELDARLKGSLVLPMWLSVTNVSPQTVRFDYADVRLDLGGTSGQAPLVPVDADVARARLRRDGHYGVLVGILASRDRIVGEPFSRRLPDGNLRPGGSKRGYVFFFRRENVPFTGFMAIGSAALAPELLATGALDVWAPADIPPPPAVSRAPSGGTRAWPPAAELVRWAIGETSKTLSEIWYGKPPFGNSYAILFGISDYTSKSKLTLVEHDLKNMSDYLHTQRFAQVKVKANKDVTRDTLRNIQRHFDAKLQPEDRLLVYYAGHGALVKHRGYLVLAESGDTLDEKTAVPMDEFVFWLRGLAVKHLLVILDACHSGAAVPGTTRDDRLLDILDRDDHAAAYQLSSAGGKYVLMAGTDSQRAHEDKRWDGGLFTKAILTSLRERPNGTEGRLITTYELFARARRFVLKETRNHSLPEQLPVFKDLGTPLSAGEFVFVRQPPSR